MDIVFRKRKFQKECNKHSLLVQKHGKNRAQLIELRLDILRDANVLEDTRNLPGNCHELHQNRAGQLSLDLDGPYRLIFEPADQPIPLKPDGGLDWNKVTAVEILGVENTHGK